MIRVAVDVVGGDFAPSEMVARAVEAVSTKPGIRVLPVGQEQTVVSELGRYTYDKDQIQMVSVTGVIATEESPVNVIRKKKDSSIVVGINLVRKEKASALVSAGGSGAILTNGQVVARCIKGVERPPLTPLIPTEESVSLLIDCGTNVNTRASYLVRFAQMGSIYIEHVTGVRNPRAAIVNIGAEREKGNALVEETSPSLKKREGTSFIGSIEAREIPHDAADVIVCEAFVGNIISKLYGDVGTILASMAKGGMMSTLRSKIGALFVKSALKQTLKAFDDSQYGGVPLLGLNGLVVKTHGNSKRTGVRNSIIQCVILGEQKINERIRESSGVKGMEQARRANVKTGL